MNLDGALNGHRFMLSIGSHRNQTLQKEWKEYGAERFVFEILETVKVSEEPDFNLRALRRAVVPGIRMDPSLGQSDSVTTVTVA